MMRHPSSLLVILSLAGFSATLSGCGGNSSENPGNREFGGGELTEGERSLEGDDTGDEEIALDVERGEEGSSTSPDDNGAGGTSGEGANLGGMAPGGAGPGGDGSGGETTSPCDAVDCGFGTCTEVSSGVACTCDAGYQDNDSSLDCTPACDLDSCSARGTCADSTGTIECTCSTGYSGADCSTCDSSLGYIATGSGCGLSLSGSGVSGDPFRYFDDTTAGSCQDYQFPTGDYASSSAQGDGIYLISTSGGAEREVRCDTVTDGGGWTLIEPSTGLNNPPTISSLLEGTCALENGAPIATDDTGDHDCFYEYDLGFDFNEIAALNFEVEMRAEGNDTTDITALPLAWETSCPSRGDVRIGVPSAAEAALSLGRGLQRAESCNSGLSLQNGERVAFSGAANVPLDDTLRIEMVETGSQAEGWIWAAGAIAVRRTTPIQGDLSQADPGRWDDDQFALSCVQYNEPTLVDGVLRSPAQSSGFFRIDRDGAGPGEAETVYCGDGEEWTSVLRWDRLNAPQEHTLASLLAQLSDELDPAPANVSLMSNLEDVPTGIRWSDGDSTSDALSLSLDLSPYATQEILVEFDFYGYSMEASGIWLTAFTSENEAVNLVCNDDTGTNGYRPEERAFIPTACTNSSSGDLRFNESYRITTTNSLTRLQLFSLMRDVDEGDYAELYRLKVAYR
ncbi:MAG: hypothetical protein MK135_14255 [Polyangiaceae bacterium]|nr:hypothetical protein [Polyangiaceae bacterium]